LIVKTLTTLLVPGGPIVLAALAILRPGMLPDAAEPYLRAFPVVVLGVGVFLGWYFNRSRVVFALLLLSVADWALRHVGTPGAAAGDAGRLAFVAVAALLPVNLALYASLTERGLLTPRGVARLLLIPGQLLAVGLVLQLDPQSLGGWLDHPVFEGWLTAWTDVPQIPLAAFAGTFVLLAVRSIRRRSPIEAGFFWAAVAAFVALHSLSRGWNPTNALATGGAVLIGALIQTAYRMAYHDELTGLPGRRALNEAFLRVGSRYAVAMVDVDHFKRFNDTYGHEVGDQVLRMVAAHLDRVGGGGRSFRYGGEEFAILFASASAAEAFPHIEALRKTIEAAQFALRGPGRPRKKPAPARPRPVSRKEVSVTVSIGLAERDGRKTRAQQVIAAADKALYRAKASGRNRVMV
jgi:diguanylate cyclase (GGDEF)-like protein